MCDDVSPGEFQLRSMLLVSSSRFSSCWSELPESDRHLVRGGVSFLDWSNAPRKPAFRSWSRRFCAIQGFSSWRWDGETDERRVEWKLLAAQEDGSREVVLLLLEAAFDAHGDRERSVVGKT